MSMTTITEDEIENLKAELDAARRLNAKLLDQIAEDARVIAAERLARENAVSELMEAEADDQEIIDALRKFWPGEMLPDPTAIGLAKHVATELDNAAALITKLQDRCAVERMTCAALREQLDGAEHVRDVALLNLSDHHAGFVVAVPNKPIARRGTWASAQARALAAVRGGSDRADVFGLVKVGSASRGAVWREAQP